MTFTVGDLVRYKPGEGTYGYELEIQADGRVPGVVMGFTAKGRVRVKMRNNRGPLVRAVDPKSLSEG